MSITETIRRLRLSLGLEQGEFAAELDVTMGTVCNWEHGRRKPRLPKIRKMVEMAKANKVKLNIEDFLED